MEMTLRWYGTGYDSVTLEQIRQIPGVRGVITTLYDTLPGEIWTPERIAAMKDEVEASGLRVSGIESVNVHDAIKAGTAQRDEMIDHYIQTLENLGKADIHMVCYNFMPVFDWTRTELARKRPDGSTVLAYTQKASMSSSCLKICGFSWKRSCLSATGMTSTWRSTRMIRPGACSVCRGLLSTRTIFSG